MEPTTIEPSRPFSSLLLCFAILLGGAACSTPSSPKFEHVIGLNYDNAREQLIRDGWSPRQGVNDGMLSGNGRVFWERGYTELVASSGTGLAPCRFEFTDHGGRVLVVETEGEESDVSHAKVMYAFLEQQM